MGGHAPGAPPRSANVLFSSNLALVDFREKRIYYGIKPMARFYKCGTTPRKLKVKKDEFIRPFGDDSCKWTYYKMYAEKIIFKESLSLI